MDKAMTSDSKYGSARNSLVWLGVAKSTHRASERVRGSGRGKARMGTAWPGGARQGKHTAAFRGRCSLRGLAWQGLAGQGLSGLGVAQSSG